MFSKGIYWANSVFISIYEMVFEEIQEILG